MDLGLELGKVDFLGVGLAVGLVAAHEAPRKVLDTLVDDVDQRGDEHVGLLALDARVLEALDKRIGIKVHAPRLQRHRPRNATHAARPQSGRRPRVRGQRHTPYHPRSQPGHVVVEST